MPYALFGPSTLIALFFAVHAVRTRQQLYWLIILFSFPYLGSLVYFLGIYLPDSRLRHGARKAVAAAVKTIDPTRELRAARDAFDYTPTAQNQMRLAAALLEAGQAEEAAANYEACLKGPFANDREMRLNAARAWHTCGRHAETVGHLQKLRAQDADFRVEQVSLLLAKSLAGAGRRQEAKAEFESVVARFGNFESRVEYAIWAAIAGEMDVAARLQIEIQRSMERWNRNTRDLHAPLVRRLDAAYAEAKARG